MSSILRHECADAHYARSIISIHCSVPLCDAAFNSLQNTSRAKKFALAMARKSKAEIEALAPLVVHFYENVGKKSASRTCRHFSETGVSPRTVRNILNRYTQEGRVTHNNKSGRTPKIGTPKVVDKVRKVFQADPNISVRRAADKLGLTRSTVSNIKVKNLGIVSYKKEVAPKYNPDQERRAKSGCRNCIGKNCCPEMEKSS